MEKTPRPAVFINAIDQPLRSVKSKAGYYAVRLDKVSILVSTGPAEAMAWKILQSQAKQRGRGKEGRR